MFRFIVCNLCKGSYAVQIGNLTQYLLWLKYSGDCFLYSLKCLSCMSLALFI